MSGGSFLVGLREVITSEKILQMRLLLKFIISELFNNGIQECQLDKGSSEVAIFISGYICRKLLKKLKCELCTLLLKSDTIDINTKYIDLIPRRAS